MNFPPIFDQTKKFIINYLPHRSAEPEKKATQDATGILERDVLKNSDFIEALVEWKYQNGPCDFIRHAICDEIENVISSKHKKLVLDYEGCNELTELPPLPPWLTHLTLTNWENLTFITNLPNSLKSLKLNHCGVDYLKNLPSELVELKLAHCPKLKSARHLPQHLKLLTVESCHEIRHFDALPHDLFELKIATCNKISALNKLPPQLARLTVTNCPVTNLDNLPLRLFALTVIRCHDLMGFTYVPPGLKSLILRENSKLCDIFSQFLGFNKIEILKCPRLIVLPDTLRNCAFLKIDTPFLFHFQERKRKEVIFTLSKAADLWLHNTLFQADDIDLFKDYFLSLNRLWGCDEAKSNPDEFAKAQIDVIEKMILPEIGDACMTLAVVGMADCHDNAFAMFLQMQEKVLEIEMNRPGIPLIGLLIYGKALENKHRLARLINATPHLKKAIKSREGAEVDLLLRFICHQLKIILPIPVKSMNYILEGLKPFLLSEGTLEEYQATYDGLCLLLQEKLQGNMEESPLTRFPAAQFLAAQPYWQNHINRTDPGIKAAIEAINHKATKRQGVAYKTMQSSKNTVTPEEFLVIEIDSGKKMLAIEARRKKAIAKLYLEQTHQVLHSFITVNSDNVQKEA